MAVRINIDLHERRECERCAEEVKAMAEYVSWFGSTIQEMFPKRFAALPYPIRYQLEHPDIKVHW